MKRTAEELQDHIERVKLCRTRWQTIAQDYHGTRFMIPIQTACHSRFCSHCSSLRRAGILDRLRYFKTVQHAVKLELTFPENSPDPLEHPEYYSHSWDVFLKRLRRKYRKIKYLRIVELTACGIPHFHIILDHYVPHQWITETFPSCGGGSVNWIRHIDGGRAFGYVVKYVVKSTNGNPIHAEFFFRSGMRQFSASRHIYFFIPRSSTFFVLHHRPTSDLSSIVDEHRYDFGRYLYSCADLGSGPPEVFYWTDRELSQLFDVPDVARHVTRADLLLARYDLTSWQAHSPFGIMR